MWAVFFLSKDFSQEEKPPFFSALLHFECVSDTPSVLHLKCEIGAFLGCF